MNCIYFIFDKVQRLIKPESQTYRQHIFSYSLLINTQHNLVKPNITYNLILLLFWGPEFSKALKLVSSQLEQGTLHCEHSSC